MLAGLHPNYPGTDGTLWLVDYGIKKRSNGTGYFETGKVFHGANGCRFVEVVVDNSDGFGYARPGSKPTCRSFLTELEGFREDPLGLKFELEDPWLFDLVYTNFKFRILHYERGGPHQ